MWAFKVGRRVWMEVRSSVVEYLWMILGREDLSERITYPKCGISKL